MELAHRYLNAIQMIENDVELKEAVISDFKRVIVSEVQTPKYPGMALVLFEDLSAIFSFDKEKVILESPEDLFTKLIPFNEKRPKIREFLKWMINDAVERKVISEK